MCDNASIKLIMVLLVNTKFYKQKYVTSISVKEIRILPDSQFQYTSNQNQFHTYIAMIVLIDSSLNSKIKDSTPCH